MLEKHKELLRAFRGDTVHPSTLEIMCKLGLLDEFLKILTCGVAGNVAVQIGDDQLVIGHFENLPVHCNTLR